MSTTILPTHTSNSFYPIATRSKSKRSKSKTPKNRDGHKIKKSAVNGLQRSAPLFQNVMSDPRFACGTEEEIAERDSAWRGLEPFIRAEFLELHRSLSPILARMGRHPETVTSAQLDADIAALKREDHRLYPAKAASCERSLDPMFSEFVRILIETRAENPFYGISPDLTPLKSVFQKLDEFLDVIPESIRSEIASFKEELRLRRAARGGAATIGAIQTACATLIHNGYSVTTLSDLIQRPNIDILIGCLEKKGLKPSSCITIFNRVRCLAAIVYKDDDADKDIAKALEYFRLKAAYLGAHPQVAKIVNAAHPSNLRETLSSLVRLAITGNNMAEARSRIEISSGACHCLLSLWCGVTPSQLPELHFTADGQPEFRLSPTSAMTKTSALLRTKQERWFKDERVKDALQHHQVKEALQGFSALFQASYQRLPRSLADGATYERDYATIVPSRISAALKAVGSDLTAKELREVLATYLLSLGQDDAAVASATGYESLLSFGVRYGAIKAMLGV